MLSIVAIVATSVITVTRKIKVASMAKRPDKADKINKRWFQDTLAAKGYVQAQLAKEVGMTASRFSSFLAGRRRLQLEEATDLARSLNVPLEDVLRNAGVDTPGILSKASAQSQMKVEGWLDQDLIIHWGTPKGPKLVPNPFQSKGLHVVRFQTAGTRYHRWDGALVYFRVPTGFDRDRVGSLCIVKIQGDEKLRLRFLERSYSPGRYTLSGIKEDVLEEDVQVELAGSFELIKQD